MELLTEGRSAHWSRALLEATERDCQTFRRQHESLMQRGEAARALRNAGRHAEAEQALSMLLAETEELCGESSCHLSNVLKSLGILYLGQGRFQDALNAFVRMDKLRVVYGSLDQHQSDLELLIQAQLALNQHADANKTIMRLISFLDSNGRACDEVQVWQTQAASNANAAASLGSQTIRVASDGMRRACLSCGATGNLKSCGGCRSAWFCSQSCQRACWSSHEVACQAMQKKVKEKNQAAAAPSARGSDLVVRPQSDSLLDAVLLNSAAAKELSPQTPSVLSSSLRAALADPGSTYFFRIGDLCSTRLLAQDGGARRFLATPGVLTCIVVFAWAPPAAPQIDTPVAVAAHVDLPCLLRGVRACHITGQDLDRALAPLTHELRHNFREVDPASVHVKFVGGHQVADKDMAFEAILTQPSSARKAESAIDNNDPRLCFSWYVKAACTAAGLTKATFDTSLLNVFEGERCVDSATELRLRQANMRFEIAALDTHTGHVITHTRHVLDDQILSPAEYRRQAQRYETRGLEGEPLYPASHKDVS